MIHMFGHTPYQAAVVVEDEGVVFTSDNIFCKVQTGSRKAA
jgi:glyoxylase-like metal-dependent hydrolase (beta-lactamase superfamily II)